MSKSFAVALGVIALVAVLIWFCPCRKAMRCVTPGMMEGKGKMCCNKGPMGQMPGAGMSDIGPKEVLLAPDGGLFVIAGNRIIKYDKDLNVVKEAEIGAGMGMMGHGMGMMGGAPSGMKMGCPMMKGAIQGENADKAVVPHVKK